MESFLCSFLEEFISFPLNNLWSPSLATPGPFSFLKSRRLFPGDAIHSLWSNGRSGGLTVSNPLPLTHLAGGVPHYPNCYFKVSHSFSSTVLFSGWCHCTRWSMGKEFGQLTPGQLDLHLIESWLVGFNSPKKKKSHRKLHLVVWCMINIRQSSPSLQCVMLKKRDTFVGLLGISVWMTLFFPPDL